MKIKINDQIPDIEIYQLVNGEPQKSKLKDTLGKEKLFYLDYLEHLHLLCSKLHLPGFVKNAENIRAKGIKEIFCLSVNDPYVMNAWGEVNNIGNKIKMLSDPYLSFTSSIGAEVDRNSKGMGIRSSRYTMVIENLKIMNIQVEKETKLCGLSSAETI